MEFVNWEEVALKCVVLVGVSVDILIIANQSTVTHVIVTVVSVEVLVVDSNLVEFIAVKRVVDVSQAQLQSV